MKADDQPEPERPEPPLDYLCDYPMPGEPDPPPPMSQIIEVVLRREPRARGWFHQAFEAAREHRT